MAYRPRSSIYVDDALEKPLLVRISQNGIANPDSQTPSGFIWKIQITSHLSDGNLLLSVQHQRHSQEPFLQGDMSIVENGTDHGAE